MKSVYWKKSRVFAIGLVLFSTVIRALFWILNIRAKEDTVKNLAESFVFGFIYLVIYGAVSGKIAGICNLDLNGIIGSVYIGLFEMGITSRNQRYTFAGKMGGNRG